MQTVPRKRKRQKRTRCKCGSTEHLTTRSLSCPLNKNHKPSLAELQIRAQEASARAQGTTSGAASTTAPTAKVPVITTPVINPTKRKRADVLASDPELNTKKKFSQGTPYTPLHPHLTEVKEGDRAQGYEPMIIPVEMQHQACFSFSAFPNAPATTDPSDVIPFLNEAFIPDKFVAMLLEKQKLMSPSTNGATTGN